MDLTIAIREERPGYWAGVVELPGCFASGRSLEELRDALGEAISLYLWDDPDVVTLAGEELGVGELRLRVVAPFD